MLTTRSQRWRDRRCHWIPNATEIDPSKLAVDIIDSRIQAAPFIAQHHYAGTMPVARLSVGLFQNGAGGHAELAGVCVFAVPMNNASVPKSTGLSDPLSACDLGRFTCAPTIAGNGESWFLSRALRILRREKPGILSVISYADPIPRRDEHGHLYMPGHVGNLYALSGSRYVGRGSARTELLMPNGQPFASRAVSKIRNGETGQRYAVEALVRAGARPPRHAEDRSRWLADLERTGFLTRRRRNGNHTYVFALTKAARLAGRRVPALPYPILDRTVIDGDVTAVPLLAGMV